ncbi:uncharacterized protein TrAtP1_005557 [Trichoderma atroviride]|nr:hypothetical protein TrAtP1_005557 [Trichoderma atroviride]
MNYEQRVNNESQFRQKARGKQTFSQLYEDKKWKAGASNWGTPELFAARAICMPTRRLMDPLQEFYSNRFDYNNAHPSLRMFYLGCGDMNDLAWQSEPKLVQAAGSNNLGGIWAALGTLLRGEKFALGNYGLNQGPTGPSRPTRQAAMQARRPQESTGSTPQSGSGSRSPSVYAASSSSESLLGYGPDIPGPLVEDATVRLISSIVRHILNYQQDTTQARLLSWRDQRVTYGYKGDSRTVSATDDGGVEMWSPGNQNFRQVALLEAKRSLRNVGGQPFVSDEILAQMVGQAIALQRSNSNYVAACQNRSVTILASTHFIRFYFFDFSSNYFQDDKYENQALENNECRMRIYPTGWLDITKDKHREDIILHVDALLRWASNLP